MSKENVLNKTGNIIKDSALLLRPLHKKEKWDLKRLETYLDSKELKKLKKLLKQGKVKIELSKLNFSFLISGMDILPILISDKDYVKELNKKIEDNYYDKLFESFSSRSYDVLFHYFASELMDLADLKRAIILQLFSKFPLHILIIGESDSGKSKILQSVRKLAPISSYGVGSSISGSGLTLSASRKKTTLGILPRADGGICCISELSALGKNNLSLLVYAMENGFVKYDKSGKSIKEGAKSRVLAIAETKGGDFKSYSISQIKKQIPFDSSFLSKFNFIFVIKKPNEEEFRVIADTIIKESVKKEISSDEINFIKKYITRCSEIKVNIPRQLSDQIEQFVSGLKELEKNLPYNITSKTVEGIVGLIKASARSEMRKEVQTKDLERVFSIVRSALQI